MGFAEEENFFPLLGIDTRFCRRPAGSVTVRSELARLLVVFPESNFR
jgi:hypothetical protein